MLKIRNRKEEAENIRHLQKKPWPTRSLLLFVIFLILQKGRKGQPVVYHAKHHVPHTDTYIRIHVCTYWLWSTTSKCYWRLPINDRARMAELVQWQPSCKSWSGQLQKLDHNATE